MCAVNVCVLVLRICGHYRADIYICILGKYICYIADRM
jgi:hypothetical protein